jgi:hypothetical protein
VAPDLGGLEDSVAAQADSIPSRYLQIAELDMAVANAAVPWHTDLECKRTYCTAAIDQLPSAESDNTLGGSRRRHE